MFHQKLKDLPLLLLLGNFAITGMTPSPANAENIFQKSLGGVKSEFQKIKHRLRPTRVDAKIENWFLLPGIKAIIYTEDDPGKAITIVSDGERIRFKSCECNQPPNCPDLLAPYYSFTPDEILTRTSTFKGKARYIFEIGAGILFLAAPNIPGIPGQAASLLGGLALLGNQINPAQKAQEEFKINDIADQIINNAENGILTGTAPVALISVGGSFSDVKSAFRNFLLSLGTKEERAQISIDAKLYFQDWQDGKVKPALSCESQSIQREDEIIERLKQIQAKQDADDRTGP